MIITVYEGNVAHYYRIVDGRRKPLSDREARELRLQDEPILGLAETAVLRPAGQVDAA